MKIELWHKADPGETVLQTLPPRRDNSKEVYVWGGKIHQRNDFNLKNEGLWDWANQVARNRI
jgi:hypothetical protein